MIKILNGLLIPTALATSVPVHASQRAAFFGSSADTSRSEAFMFGGATVRLDLGNKARKSPQAALRFAGATRSQDGRSLAIGEGYAMEFGAGRKPRLTIAGQDSVVLGKRLGMSSGAKTALIAGGVLIVAGAALLLAADGAVDDMNEDCCGSIND